MSRTMYDSVTPERIPADAQLVAGYIQGPYAWSAADWARFPHAVHVQIATVAYPPAGMVLDVEAGDAAPDLAPVWVNARRAAGVDPSVYMSMSAWPTVRAAFTTRGMREPHYWVADYDDIAVVPVGAVAKQYVNERPAGCDTSIVLDYWPGVDSAPTINTQGDDMLYLFVVAAPVNAVWCLHAGHYFHVTEPTSETAFAAIASHPPVDITPAQHAVLQQTYPNDATVAGGGPIAQGGAL